MQKELKEIEQAMDEMSPEEKQMMEKMGVKDLLDNVKKNNGKEMQEAWDNAGRPLPKRDAARIAAISRTPLTDNSIAGHLASVHNKVITVLKPTAKTTAENIYAELKKSHNPAAIGNSAAGLWIMGKNEMAIYLMGKACIDDPTNTDNISNYAAMLSMNAGEHLALPFLNYLNTKFPKNSTVLNNIGQAWFGLGEINKAEKYLDSTIRIYAYHPQANFTIAVIEESKGQITKAVEAAKRSIKKTFSSEKENFLRKNNHKITPEDLSWDAPLPKDPLGLEKFIWPDYPFNVKQQDKLKAEWQSFTDSCNAENLKLELLETGLEQMAEAATEKRIQLMKKQNPAGMPIPLTALKAHKKLKYLVFEKDGAPITESKKSEAVHDAIALVENIEKPKYEAALTELHKKYNDKFGEGKENPFDEACADYNEANSAYLEGANKILLLANSDYLDFLRRMLNNQMNYKQYTIWPEELELEKVRAKRKWLLAISTQMIILDATTGKINCRHKEDKKLKHTKMAEFDDVACKYHSVLSLPVGTIKIDCSRITTELDLNFVKLGLKQDMDKVGFGNQFISATVEVGVEVGKEVEVGPLTIGATVGAGVGIEIDRTGITDVYVTGKAGVGVEAGPVNVEVGAEGRVGINTGKATVTANGSVGLKGIQ